MKILIFLSLFPLLSFAETKCLETIPLPPEVGIAKLITDDLTNQGWSLVKGKLLKVDLDQNGRDDFALLLKKEDQLRTYIVWDGIKISYGDCHSDLISPTRTTELTDDACKLKFEKFKQGNLNGILIRTHDTFTYKYLCKVFSQKDGSRIWHNIGTPD